MAKRRSKLGTSKGTMKNNLEDLGNKEAIETMNSLPTEFFKKETMTPIKIFATDSLDSSTDICEVGWDSRSPITMSQVARYRSVDTSELVKSYAEERGTISRDLPSLSTWRDQSDSDDGISNYKYRAERFLRGRGRRKRGRASGLKSGMSSREMFQQLEAMLDDPEPAKASTENDATKKCASVASDRETTETKGYTGVRSSTSTEDDHSFDLFEATQQHTTNPSKHQPFASTQKVLEQKFGQSSASKPALSESPILRNKAKSKKSPLMENVMLQNQVSDNLTPKRPTPFSAQRRNGTLRQNLDNSMDELWSDEDGLFDNDSFIIKATQGCFNGITPPRALKRKTPQSSPDLTNANKVGRFTFSLGPSTKEKTSPLAVHANRGQAMQAPQQVPFNNNKEASSNSNCKRDFKFAKPKCRSPLATTGTSAPKQHTQTISTKPTVMVSTKPSSTMTSSTNRNHVKSVPPKPFASNSSKPPVAKVPAAHSSTAEMRKFSIQVQGIKPLNGQNNCVRGLTNSNAVRHSTPQRTTKGALLDTSLTDDLLASLAEPDDVLDSQMGGADLLDSQSYRETLSLTPEEKDFTSVVFHPGSTKPTDKSSSEGGDLIPDDAFGDDAFDEFGDNDDEQLSEEQMLRMLDIVESSQQAEALQPSSKVAVTSKPLSKADPLVNFKESHQSTSTLPRDRNLTTKTVPVCKYPQSKPVNNSAPKFGGAAQLKTNLAKLEMETKTTSSSASCFRASNSYPCAKPNHLPLKTPIENNNTKKPSAVVPCVAVPNDSICPSANTTQPSGSQRYSKEDIERKKQEAIKRRLNRLKLAKPKPN